MPRINLLFILIILLTACTPNATPAPMPTVTSSPVVTETAKIDMFPAGFGLSPTSSPETEQGNAEFFKEPTTADATKYMGVEANIPEQIVDVVSNYMDKLEKKRAEIALSCVVPEYELKFVFKVNGQSGDIYRWTIVAQAGDYTCWSLDAKTGKIAEYPTYFDPDSGELMSVAQGVQWERLEGKFTFGGKTAALGNSRSFVVPAGLTGSEVNDPSRWSTLAVETVKNLNPIANPISSKNMAVLSVGGYYWDADAGVLKGRDGQNVLSLLDGKWVDPATGVTTELSALSQVEVNAMDFQGREVGAVLTREVNGETQIYLPSSDVWVVPIDVASSQQTIDRPDLPKAERGNHRSIESVVLANLPEISFDDFKSDRLYYSELRATKPLPENVRVPDLHYARLSFGTNVWAIIDSVDNDPGQPYMMPFTGSSGRPALFENDGIQNLGAYNMKDPLTGQNMVVKAQQYYFNGHTVILHMVFGDSHGDVNDPNGSYITKSSLNSPSDRITFPLVNIRPHNEDWCGQGGLGEGFVPQPSICALQGYELDLARDLLPAELQNMISQFDTGVQLTSVATESYPIGSEIYGLQQLPLPQNSFFERPLDFYLLPENSPLLK